MRRVEIRKALRLVFAALVIAVGVCIIEWVGLSGMQWFYRAYLVAGLAIGLWAPEFMEYLKDEE